MTIEEQKYIYEYLTAVDFDYGKLIEIAKKFNTNYQNIINMIEQYLETEKELKGTALEKEMLKIRQKVQFSNPNIPYQAPKRQLGKEIYEFILENNYNYEKLLEFEYDYEYMMSSVESYLRVLGCETKTSEIRKKLQYIKHLHSLKLDKENPFLIKYGIKTKYLYTNDEERKLFEKELLDFILKHHLGKTEMLDKLVEELGFDNLNLLGTLYEKVTSSLRGKERADFQEKVKISAANSVKKSIYEVQPYVGIFEKLIKAKTYEEINEIINMAMLKYNYTYSDLRFFKLSFLNYQKILKVSEEVIRMYEEIIDRNFKIYSDFRKKETAEKIKQSNEAKKNNKLEERKQLLFSRLSEYKQLIIEFLNYDHLIGRFCKYKKIERQHFNDAMEALSYFDQALYCLCCEEIKNRQKQQYAVIVIKLENIIDCIKNGIVENGVTRPFDIVDYFRQTSISFENLVSLGQQNLSNEENKILKRFVAQNKNYSNENTAFSKEILSQKVIINTKKDEKGNLIPNSGEEVTIETKQNVLNYLKRYHIPINAKTYNIVFRRYLSGEIILDDKEEEIKR